MEGSKIAGAYVDTTAGKTTFEQYMEKWRSVQVHRPSAAAQIETHLRRHVYPQLGRRPLGQLRPSELQAWAKHLSGELAPATVEVVYRYVVAILRAAVANRVISSSPAVGVRLPKDPPRMVEPLRPRSSRRSWRGPREVPGARDVRGWDWSPAGRVLRVDR